MRIFDIITQILLIVGGLNWLLVGLFQFDLVAAIFGGQTALLSRAIYVIVGLCAIWQLIRLPAMMGKPEIAGTTTRPVDRR
ncbi:DUF378 domain-containing protein [Cypionkella sp.]|uniref:DUF378 domain-containing protein n=1 Tax=Cypionkella sp. TaxID=2811411 RepID=UPI0026109CDF|nr:DUF378 domain-containing protein [Cypionkella sp.]MDB5664535.1 hypothetical protein [Cypionkella sp.]